VRWFRHARMSAGPLVVVLLIAGAIAAAGMPTPAAGAADHTVAVVMFYAPSPVITYPGVVPEEYVASDLSTILAASSGGRFTVVPRDRVRAEESALRWREWDALRFARLAELASAVGADRVVVGWIRQFTVEGNGGGGGQDFDLGGGAGGLITGTAVVQYQIFDATQGRIVYETQVEGHGTGGPNLPAAARITLEDVDRHGAALLVAPLTAGTGGL
jgi:curli biogenesis system outer membrane secretion channel CsgG